MSVADSGVPRGMSGLAEREGILRGVVDVAVMTWKEQQSVDEEGASFAQLRA